MKCISSSNWIIILISCMGTAN